MQCNPVLLSGVGENPEGVREGEPPAEPENTPPSFTSEVVRNSLQKKSVDDTISLLRCKLRSKFLGFSLVPTNGKPLLYLGIVACLTLTGNIAVTEAPRY